jgi:predicted transcriptional regulator
LATGDSKRRDELLEKLHRGPGWTLSDITVVLASFIRAARAYVALAGRQPEITAVVLDRIFSRFEHLQEATIREFLRDAAEGRVAGLEILKDDEKLAICALLFADMVVQLRISPERIAQLIVAGERSAETKGWQSSPLTEPDQ